MTPAAPLPPVQAYHPATFQERGVAVPFTTPLLLGARGRRGQRYRVEMVVPNPSGGRGVYILPWASVRSLCRPTVHDSRLNQRIAALPVLTPASMRQATLEVASQGLAGRPAMEAANAAAASDRKDRLLTNFLLLITLAEQTEHMATGFTVGRRERSLELEHHARRIIAQVAPSLGRSPADILGALAALTEVFWSIGAADQSVPARIPRLIDWVSELRDELADWIRDHCDDNHVELADMIAEFAGLTVTAARTTLATAQAMTRDVTGLLRSWSKSPDRVTGIATRSEWLLDGWEQVCLLWRSDTGGERRRAALTEMAQLVPMLPLEIAEWVPFPTDTDDNAVCETINLNMDWRTGAAVLNLTARNERLRALAV